MQSSKPSYTNIDEYIAMYPKKVQSILQKIRKVIQKAAPEAIEGISYAIPTFKFHGNLVHFAAYEHHIGFYPGSAGVDIFKKDLKDYKWSKGTIQFQLDEPIPYDLIKKITEFRVKQNSKKK